MNAFGHILFNLLANSVVSFLLALAVVYAALRLFRVESGRCRLWLLLLPIAKMLQELASGVPESSFLWAKLAGRSQDLGTFRLGIGVTQYMPKLSFELGAFSGGLIYPQSAGDVLDAGLSKHLGPVIPGALATAVVILGLVRQWFGWQRARAFRRDALRDARVVERRSIGRRVVEVCVSEHYTGVPFATGIASPRVVFSAETEAAFTPQERDAALQHELAHIAHHDLALLAVLRVFENLFWFLPGARGLLTRIHAVLEQRADDAALTAGAQPAALASALVRAGEALRGAVPGAAILSNRSLLAQRVYRLLARAPSRSRVRKRVVLFEIGVALLVTLTLAQALFLGNHAAALVRFAIP